MFLEVAGVEQRSPERLRTTKSREKWIRSHARCDDELLRQDFARLQEILVAESFRYGE